ncbi:MAG: VWA domain-containing protein [Actinomycetota bacterium]
MVFSRRRHRTPRRQPAHFSYSRWDGTQTGFDLDADHLFGEMADELLYHGDVNSALRQMMQNGLMDRDGRDMEGIRDMMQRLRERRREILDSHNLGGVYDDIAESLRDVVETERAALDDLAQPDGGQDETGDERQQQLQSDTAAMKNMELDMLPPDLAGQVKGLQNYDFESPEARQQFEELMDQLREQLMQQQLDQIAEGINDMSPEEMQRLKDMMAELNQMLEQRANGVEPDFEGFMERYGDFFPENPQTLDELLEVMAQRMAQAQQMMNSMTPEQRQQLQELSNQLMEDMDLNFQMQQLADNLREQFPQMGWGQSYDFDGFDPLDMGSAMDMMGELGDIDQLDNLLRGATNPGALAEVDIDRARELLGDESAESLERMAELAKLLEEQGLIENKEGKYELTPRAIRKIGNSALDELFKRMSADTLGKHALEKTGAGHERDYDTKPYEYGDRFNLHIEKTLRNAVARTGGGTPVKLHPDDFEIERTEQLVRSSTVLMLDVSMSMAMRDNFLPAKKVTMALHSLISSQYPRDFLGMVSFSEVAREFNAATLPELSWDYVYGTNMQHAFQIARKMLGKQAGTKQIIMITDGEPTAHITPSGQPYFNYPPSQQTVDLTLAEVAKCTREDIRINTFVLDVTHYLQNFVEQISKMNGGRAFFTTNENLGDYVLMDFVDHKRSLVRGR